MMKTGSCISPQYNASSLIKVIFQILSLVYFAVLYTSCTSSNRETDITLEDDPRYEIEYCEEISTTKSNKNELLQRIISHAKYIYFSYRFPNDIYDSNYELTVFERVMDNYHYLYVHNKEYDCSVFENNNSIIQIITTYVFEIYHKKESICFILGGTSSRQYTCGITPFEFEEPSD